MGPALVFRLTAGRVIGVMRREFAAPHYVMVVGTESRHTGGATLEQSAQYGVRLRGFLSETPDARRRSSARAPGAAIADLPVILRRHVVDEIVFSVAPKPRRVGRGIPALRREGVRTASQSTLPACEQCGIAGPPGRSPLLTFPPRPTMRSTTAEALHRSGYRRRRTNRIVPLMLLVIVLIKLVSRAGGLSPGALQAERPSVCVLQIPLDGGQPAEEMKKDLEHLNVRDTAFKIPDDPRLIIGRYLRKFSIDEWPQLWRTSSSATCPGGSASRSAERSGAISALAAAPMRGCAGLTCLWAISGRDNVDFETWMKMDMQYIDN